MENISICPVCGQNNFSKILSCKDYVALGNMFDIQSCINCTLVFTSPRPGVNEIEPYYKSEMYISHASTKKGLIYILYDLVRNFSIKQKISLIKRNNTNGKLMDLGCGLGSFLKGVVDDKTFDAIGVDISDDAVKYVKKTFNLDIINESQLDDLANYSFDIITQWHVLEHVHLLNNRMKQLHNLLAPNGTMYIAVPNSNSWDAKHYKQYWDGFDVPRHLYHFNQKSFGMLMQNHGFKIIKTHAMWFDAPYISMRSETHKGHSFPFIMGAISGLRSTFSALFSGEYSSLLYVVKKV